MGASSNHGGERVAAEPNATTQALKDLLDRRVAVLDGAWGTMFQNAGLTPADYQGDRFSDHPADVPATLTC